MKSIGIDIGTTSICAVLVDVSTKTVIKTVSCKNDSFIKTSNTWEKIQDVSIIERHVFDLLDEIYCDDVKSIGVTGQMHGIVYVNSEGLSVSPLYTWQDERGALPKENTSYADSIGARPGFGLATDLYNEDNNLVPKDAVKFCTIHDYIVMRLTGRKSPYIHSSDAASFGAFDVKSNSFTVKNARIPEYTSKLAIAGEYKDVPVSVAIGDNQASFLGAGCTDGDALANVGTGSQISIMTKSAEVKEGLELRPLYEDKYLLAGCAICGGRSYAMLEGFFKEVIALSGLKSPESLYDKMFDAAIIKKNTDLLINNSFCGTRENPSLRASITNLSIDNFSPADFVLGTLEGIARELYDMYLLSGVKCKRIVGSGNGIRKNSLLKEIFKDMFGTDLVLSTSIEEAAYGASLFSMAVCNMIELKGILI